MKTDCHATYAAGEKVNSLGFFAKLSAGNYNSIPLSVLQENINRNTRTALKNLDKIAADLKVSTLEGGINSLKKRKVNRLFIGLCWILSLLVFPAIFAWRSQKNNALIDQSQNQLSNLLKELAGKKIFGEVSQSALESCESLKAFLDFFKNYTPSEKEEATQTLLQLEEKIIKAQEGIKNYSESAKRFEVEPTNIDLFNSIIERACGLLERRKVAWKINLDEFNKSGDDTTPRHREGSPEVKKEYLADAVSGGYSSPLKLMPPEKPMPKKPMPPKKPIPKKGILLGKNLETDRITGIPNSKAIYCFAISILQILLKNSGFKHILERNYPEGSNAQQLKTLILDLENASLQKAPFLLEKIFALVGQKSETDDTQGFYLKVMEILGAHEPNIVHANITKKYSITKPDNSVCEFIESKESNPLIQSYGQDPERTVKGVDGHLLAFSSEDHYGAWLRKKMGPTVNGKAVQAHNGRGIWYKVEDNQWICAAQRYSIKTEFSDPLPQNLVFSVREVTGKPLKGPLTPNLCIRGCNYELTSIVCSPPGHYNLYQKIEGKWYFLDDARATPVTAPPQASMQANMVVYTQTGGAAPAD